MTDWRAWHTDYDIPDSALARRLSIVQEQIRTALAGCPPGPVRVISLCSGQGRDLLEVLKTHLRRDDVWARLVELDPDNTAFAAEFAASAGLRDIETIAGDAGLTDHYDGIAPANIVVACGVFGNIVDADVERLIGFCAQLCQTGGTVVWTQHRRMVGRVPLICRRFEERLFERRWLSDPDLGFCVGMHRFTGEPTPLAPGRRMFTFVGSDRLSDK